MMVSADIDGLVSAAMLASVAPGFDIVAFSIQSTSWLLHPDVVAGPPEDLFGVDVFSVQHANVSNHIVRWGEKRLRNPPVLEAFRQWDATVDLAAAQRLLAVPSLWAATEAGYEDERPRSSKYKYPLGTAQILLAMLEAGGHAPKFYDRTYLPWLVANCDGGITTYAQYANNARVWWPVMAGAVGPGSLTEQIYRMVDTMRPHDFLDAVHRLDRERQAVDGPAWLNDKWNLAGHSTATIKTTLAWLAELTGWRDPVRGGTNALDDWMLVPAVDSAEVYYGNKTPSTEAMQSRASRVKARDDPAVAASLIAGASRALNANFYVGGQTGSRFNWVGGW